MLSLHWMIKVWDSLLILSEPLCLAASVAGDHHLLVSLQERQKQLESLGISLQTSGIKVGDDKCFLVNLNADPALNELLVYYLKVSAWPTFTECLVRHGGLLVTYHFYFINWSVGQSWVLGTSFHFLSFFS